MKHSDLTKKDVAKEGKMPQAAIDALAKKNGKSTKKDSKKRRTDRRPSTDGSQSGNGS